MDMYGHILLVSRRMLLTQGKSFHFIIKVYFVEYVSQKGKLAARKASWNMNRVFVCIITKKLHELS